MSRNELADPIRRGLIPAAILAMVAAHGLVRAHELAPAPVSGFELPQPKSLKGFTLRNHLGADFSSHDLAGRWSFVFFGFTHCPDVCPTALKQLQELMAGIRASSNRIPTQTVLISIDPARDTTARLASYVANFGPHVVGVNGSNALIDALADQFRVKYEIAAGSNRAGRGYVFDHTASVSLVGPDRRLYAVFTLPVRMEQVRDQVLRIASKHRAEVCPTLVLRTDVVLCAGMTT